MSPLRKPPVAVFPKPEIPTSPVLPNPAVARPLSVVAPTQGSGVVD
ncbi:MULTISPECIES: hypothetical protein [Mycobacterium ulcerans group]|nr:MULTISPECIES: hypothetical protein [Mycobacterium ulcerans group]